MAARILSSGGGASPSTSLQLKLETEGLNSIYKLHSVKLKEMGDPSVTNASSPYPPTLILDS